MRKLLGATLLALAAIALASAGFLYWAYTPVSPFEPASYEPVAPEAWPTRAWARSTPEAQGMRSEKLLEMLEAYRKAAREDPELYIDSLTVIRNGTLVADFYGNPRFPRGELHVLHSATKSIVSALIGIAIEQGHIDDVDVPIVEIFSDRSIRNLDERKRALTVRHLLSMTSGLHSRDSFLYAYEGLFEMQHSDDWLQFALDLPMAAEPGTRFDYSNISTFLLSAVIVETTGMDTLAFARQHLFGPLGIDRVRWEWNDRGYPIAWARMWLEPEDMAKIGLLYLQQGRWDGRQILPAAWVRHSVTPSAYPKNAVDLLDRDGNRDGEASTRNFVAARFFRPFADGYGYQWWLDRAGPYAAMGTNGQFIMVAPRQNLVFVVTAKCTGRAQFTPATLFFDYVIPAVVSERALPVDLPALERLAAAAGPPFATQEARAVPELPDTARRVSGRTYRTESNPFNTDQLRFVFPPGQDWAEVGYTARESWDVAFRVGLDGVPRSTPTGMGVFSAAGRWTSPTTFAMEVEIVGYSTFDRWEFRFAGDEVRVTEFSIAGDYTYTGKAD